MNFFTYSKLRALLVLFDLFGYRATVAQLRDNPTTNQRRRLVDVAILGDNGSPASAFPLGKCQGDCDATNDCADNLICYLRNSGDPVPPGCSGTPTGGKDYCYDPNDSPAPAPDGSLAIVGDNGVPSSVFPLGKCQGDCDNDSQCAGNLRCFQRSQGDPAPPGCTGTVSGSKDYCYEIVVHDVPLALAGDNGNPASAFPLGRCQGDCDSNKDCASGLVCFLRIAGQAVPGCSGTPEGNKDYCIRPEDLAGTPTTPVSVPAPALAPVPVRVPVPVLAPVPVRVPAPALAPVPVRVPAPALAPVPVRVPAPVLAPVPVTAPAPMPVAAPSGALVIAGDNGSPTSVFPLKHCQGDCDSDSDCAVNLVCFERNSGQAVPGCTGAPEGNKDYCIRKEDLPPELNDTGENYVPAGAFPLGLCEGDCDGDSDCAEGLVCHQRRSDDPVPSCVGGGITDNDYCIRPSDETARPPISGAFRLKLYWESGYYWQEEFWEREWCMECSSSVCDLLDELELHECSDESTWFVFRNLDPTTGYTQIQIATTTLCIENTGNQLVELRTCVDSSLRQKFVAGNGSFGGDKFELQTVFNANGCLASHHHPKAGEIVYRNDCSSPRGSDTSFWNKY